MPPRVRDKRTVRIVAPIVATTHPNLNASYASVTRNVLTSMALIVTSIASSAGSKNRRDSCGRLLTPRSTTSTVSQIFFFCSHAARG